MGKGRAPCCDKSKVKKGPWSPAEDLKLVSFIQKHGHPNWRSLPKLAGLLRCGKSCRLRWINYLRPDVKRGNFSPEEEDAIIKLHNSFGNRWSQIASCLPGRTDNEIKNVWNTHLKKRLTEKKPKKISSSSSSSTSSSISSNASQFSNSIQSLDVSLMAPKEEIGSQFTMSDINEMIESIPLDFDNEFWNMLDNIDSFEAQITNQSQSRIGPNEMKLIQSLENELGLNCDDEEKDYLDHQIVGENNQIGILEITPLWN